MPCLHDKVLAAAVEAAINVSMDQKRKQNPAAGILGGIIKGLKGKGEEDEKLKGSLSAQSMSEQLESIFLKESFAESSIPNPDEPIELSIDDIDIDDEIPLAPPPASSSMSHVNKKMAAEEERAKLFEGSSYVEKPRMRTHQEILTKYSDSALSQELKITHLQQPEILLVLCYLKLQLCMSWFCQIVILFLMKLRSTNPDLT